MKCSYAALYERIERLRSSAEGHRKELAAIYKELDDPAALNELIYLFTDCAKYETGLEAFGLRLEKTALLRGEEREVDTE